MENQDWVADLKKMAGENRVGPAHLGHYLKLQRRRMGWSQVQLAMKLGVTQPTLSKWERGVGVPSVVEWISFLDLL